MKYIQFKKTTVPRTNYPDITSTLISSSCRIKANILYSALGVDNVYFNSSFVEPDFNSSFWFCKSKKKR